MVKLFLPLSFGKRKETKKIYKKGDIKNYKMDKWIQLIN